MRIPKLQLKTACPLPFPYFFHVSDGQSKNGTGKMKMLLSLASLSSNNFTWKNFLQRVPRWVIDWHWRKKAVHKFWIFYFLRRNLYRYFKNGNFVENTHKHEFVLIVSFVLLSPSLFPTSNCFTSIPRFFFF